MLASWTPALFIACRMWSSFGAWSKFTRICVPPVKSTPFGMPCQNSMLSTPATEKIRENPRKYHFFPSQSIFVLRKNSTLRSFVSQNFSCPPERSVLHARASPGSKSLNRKRCSALLVLQVRVEDHPRHKHCGKQVRQQTESQRHCETTNRTSSEQEQNERRN